MHALRNIPLGRLTHNWHFDTQIILEFVKQGYRIKEVPIPTYYGDEICHVNGIPYAMQLHVAGAEVRLLHRWTRCRERPTQSDAALPTSSRPQE